MVDRGYGKKAARRFALFTDNLPARTLQHAKEALETKRHERREDSLPILGRKPIFGDYCNTHFEKAKVQRKPPGTVENERQAIARWRSHLGHVRIDKIATPMIAAFLDRRLKGGAFGGRKLESVSERTANLDLMALRNVLKSAIDREIPAACLMPAATHFCSGTNWTSLGSYLTAASYTRNNCLSKGNDFKTRAWVKEPTKRCR